ncbi:class I SAM-dependent methyltransferase [Paenibacillus bovis]|uniref:Methyltransferase type 11 domain-containing protein n=1 Tax=Paenibacillus bovis TaxID=1616788 RepID=A0A172ZLM2_9BACL|nr:class I SAM-dependent methyltransferase [Paenibacillus bovis]ANF98443.1 hypothetical protein AR543_22275 [Paenibacillus bovis]
MDFTGERYIPDKVFGEIEVEHKQRYHAILDFVKNKKVLDAACGEGYGTNLISQYATHVTGIDISEDSIRWASGTYRSDNTEFIVSDIQTLPLPDHSVDVVVSFETIEHVDSAAQERFLHEIKRVLTPGGMLIMSTPDKRLYSDIVGFTNHFHIREFYYSEFEDFLKTKFQHIHMFRQGFCTFSYLSSAEVQARTGDYYRLHDIHDTPNNGKYLIALCSDQEISDTEKINSIMPSQTEQVFPSKLFVKYGQDGTEESCFTGELTIEGREFKVCFDHMDHLDSIHSVKWQPVDGYITRLHIVSSSEPARFVPLNAFSQTEEYAEFHELDPQFAVELEHNDISALTIQGHIQILNGESVFKMMKPRIDRLEAQLETEREEKQHLHNLLLATLHERDGLLVAKQELEHENVLVTSSTSWQITKPLRAISRVVKRPKKNT